MDQRNDFFGPFLTGLVIGAVAVILSDQRTRQRLENTFHDVRDTAEETVDKARDVAAKKLSQAEKSLTKKRQNGFAAR